METVLKILQSRRNDISALVLLCAIEMPYLNPHDTLADESTWPVCVGFDPVARSFGPKSSKFGDPADCPIGFAFLAVAEPLGPRRSPEQIYTEGDCCELPAGALTDSHSFQPESCPDDSLVTGAMKASDGRYLVRCTQIDVAQFALGPRILGHSLEFSRENLYPFLTDIFSFSSRTKPIRWDDIPISFRRAIGRRTRDAWRWEACVGETFPSLLVAKHGKYCEEHEFRTLLKRVSPKGPSRHLPFADCRAVDDHAPERPDCIR